MNIHEYQAKTLMKSYGVNVSPGRIAHSVEEALEAASTLQGPLWVVKAQIHAGGRGKAGGVILCRTLEEVRAAVNKLLGSTLVTHQTGPKGQQVQKVYIESGCHIERELYLSYVLDRTTGQVAVIASPAGGMDIEQVAHDTPEKILQFSIDPAIGFMPYQGRKLGAFLGLKDALQQQLILFCNSLYKAFLEKDCSQIEINPLVVTKEGNLLALDAKIGFDDNALYRQQDIENLRDLAEEDPMEIKARAYELNYVKLEGSIGCMVNGAGLAMATMDIIKLHGGEPANFLDVGGGATQERVAEAFKLILADPGVKGVLINIFGGIMRCDVIAEGILAAAKNVSISVPLVVRLQGTNWEKGQEILEKSGLNIYSENDLSAAAQRIVAVAI